MIRKILLPSIVLTISYCTSHEIIEMIQWSAIGSTATMKCHTSRCFWRLRESVKYGQSIGNFDMQISNVSRDDEGEYLCHCDDISYMYILRIKGQPRFLEKDKTNILLGTEGYNLTLTCVHIPDPPTNISANTCPGISISWTPRASGNVPQVFYIEYKQEETKPWGRIGPIIQASSTGMRHQISEVSLDTFYEIRIFAENELGQRIFSPIVRTQYLTVITCMTEGNFVVPIGYWLVLGAVSGSLIFICILSHICHHRGIKCPVAAANNLQLETLYEEIGSVQYQLISVAPVVPAPRQVSVEINSTRYEIGSANDSRGSFENATLETTLPDYGSGQLISEHVVNLRNSDRGSDNLEPEFDNNSSEDHPVNSENYENLHTPLRQDTHEEHPYSLCSISDAFLQQNTHTMVDNNDYINLML